MPGFLDGFFYPVNALVVAAGTTYGLSEVVQHRPRSFGHLAQEALLPIGAAGCNTASHYIAGRSRPPVYR